MQIAFKIINSQLVPYGKADIDKISKLKKEAVYVANIKTSDERTIKQNRALHKWFKLVADEFNEKDISLKDVVKVGRSVNEHNIKEFWRELQVSMLKKKSTTALTKDELTKVYETMNLALWHKFGISVPFPSIEQ